VCGGEPDREADGLDDAAIEVAMSGFVKRFPGTFGLTALQGNACTDPSPEERVQLDRLVGRLSLRAAPGVTACPTEPGGKAVGR